MAERKSAKANISDLFGDEGTTNVAGDLVSEEILKEKRAKEVNTTPDILKEKKYYTVKITGRAKNGEGRTRPMTFEITKDMAEALNRHVAEKKKTDKSFNKSIAIRKGIALYLATEKAGKRDLQKDVYGIEEDKGSKKSN